MSVELCEGFSLICNAGSLTYQTWGFPLLQLVCISRMIVFVIIKFFGSTGKQLTIILVGAVNLGWLQGPVVCSTEASDLGWLSARWGCVLSGDPWGVLPLLFGFPVLWCAITMQCGGLSAPLWWQTCLTVTMGPCVIVITHWGDPVRTLSSGFRPLSMQ